MTNTTYESANLFLGIVTGIIGLFGIPGNLIVIYLTLTTISLREKPHCWLIFNLALADLIFCLNNCLLESNQVVDEFRDELFCKLAAFIEYTSAFTSFLVVPAVALNRFAILHADVFVARKLFSSQVCISIYCILSWFYSIATFLPFAISSKLGHEELGLCGIIATGWSHIYWVVAVATPILLSYATVLYCYVHIVRQIRAHENDVEDQEHPNRLYSESTDLVRMMLLICAIPLFTQLPSVFLKTVLPYFPDLSLWWSRILVSPFPLTSACNPYIVLFIAKSYSRAFWGSIRNCHSRVVRTSTTYEAANRKAIYTPVSQLEDNVGLRQSLVMSDIELRNSLVISV